MEHYVYNGVSYSTEAEAQQAAVQFKNDLETKPTMYCSVKELSGDAESGWVVPQTALSDAEILAVSDGKYYSFHSQLEGRAHIGISAAEVLTKVDHFKRLHAQEMQADKINHIMPTDEDMSGYM